MNYVYIRSEPQLWTVGFYKPDGKWEPESDHSSPEGASRKVALLNGSSSVFQCRLCRGTGSHWEDVAGDGRGREQMDCEPCEGTGLIIKND